MEKKYTVLFCDDDENILDQYKELIKNNPEFLDKIEARYSQTFYENTQRYDPVSKMVETFNDKIDIAFIDMDFSTLSISEFMNGKNLDLKRLGTNIASYLREKFIKIDICFVSSKEDLKHIFTNNLKAEGIDYIDKGISTEELFVEIKEKLKVLLGNKIFNNENSNDYQYYIDIENESKISWDYKLILKNKKIKHINENKTLKFDITLTKNTYITLLSLIKSCCFSNNILKNRPSFITSAKLRKEIDKIHISMDKPDYVELPNELIKTIFKKVTEKNKPQCGDFNTKKQEEESEKLNFGKDDECKNSCDSFQIGNTIHCPLKIIFTNYKVNKREIRKEINSLRTHLKSEINKNLLKKDFDINQYRWSDEHIISDKCSCSTDNKDSIKNCRYPFCPQKIITSNENNRHNGEYIILSKPDTKFENYIKGK